MMTPAMQRARAAREYVGDVHVSLEFLGLPLVLRVRADILQGRPARLSGPPEDCYEADPDELLRVVGAEVITYNGIAICADINFDALPVSVQDDIIGLAETEVYEGRIDA